ncbi:hypothetical protein KAT80_02495 [Candidatus Pacearchaeota archaeon]|nr:hypothetical protein [Candidatus Pacearchaeota archaeon]
MFSNKSKKAMSTVIVALILIALVLIAIGMVWMVIKKIMVEGTSTITKAQFAIYSRMDLKIETAQVNKDTNKLTVKVKRSSGKGNLSGINFIVGNETFSKSVKRDTDLGELEYRTFVFDLAEFNLNIESAKEVSIAPIIISGGEEIIGEIMDTAPIKQVSFEEEIPLCSENSDCGTDNWVSGTEYCSGDSILQEWMEYLCELEGCSSQSNPILKENCSAQGKVCFAGECLEEPTSCSENSDCGEDSWIPGTEYCDQDDNVWQKWEEYICEHETCKENIIDKFKEECALTGQICFQGECFTPLECFEHSDCNVGEMCKDNECIPEYVINSGTIYSIWPIGGGEYFDSPDLPKSEVNYINYFVRFTGSESRCLKITEHVYPDSPEYNSYIKLNSTSSIQAGENYDIWQTLWGCYNQV